MASTSSDSWDDWGQRRPAAAVLHLDSAAAGRQSIATLAATASHALLEAELGAYVAEERAADVLRGLNEDLGGLLGLPAEAVALLESATAALRALLDAWPLPPQATIGVVPVEWGPNLETFAARGYETVALPNLDGRLDVDGLRELLQTRPPDVVHLTHVTSHRGLVQPVAAALAVCRAAGVPLWVDAAQAVGHVDVSYGADAIYTTSRKWFNGPRGVGMLAVAPSAWDRLRVPESALDPNAGPVARLTSHEAHVPGRVGLANAVREYLRAGPARVAARLSRVGQDVRDALADLPGWSLPGEVSDGSIVALRPEAGQDVAQVRRRLLDEHRILTTAGATARAPQDRFGPLLRISAHVDCTPADLGRLATALAQL